MKNSDKMTNVKALAFVLDNVEGLPDDVTEKLEKMRESYEKKSTTRKPTAAQVANVELSERVLDFLATVESVQAKDIVKPLDLTSSQKASSLLNSLVKDGKAFKATVKGSTLFSLTPFTE